MEDLSPALGRTLNLTKYGNVVVTISLDEQRVSADWSVGYLDGQGNFVEVEAKGFNYMAGDLQSVKTATLQYLQFLKQDLKSRGLV